MVIVFLIMHAPLKGKHLAELCKAEYPKYVNYCLWVMAEVAVIAADIPEGVSIGAKLLCGPLAVSSCNHSKHLWQ